MLSFGFYFSFTYDLSRSRESHNNDANALPNQNYWWNQFLMRDLISQKIDKKWQIVVIQVIFNYNTKLMIYESKRKKKRDSLKVFLFILWARN